MARAIGTTLGIALVTWVLHLAAGGQGPETARDPSPLAFGMLALTALAGAATTLARRQPDRTIRYSGAHRRRSGRWRSVSLLARPGRRPAPEKA